MGVGIAAAWAASASDLSRDTQWDRALEALRLQELRLATVNFRLTTANDVLCDRHLPQTGIVIQDAQQYRAELRSAATRFFNLENGPAVMVVVPGSPAARAGLQAGDVLTAVNGRPVADGGEPDLDMRARNDSGDYAAMEALSLLMDEAFTKGRTSLSIRRGDTNLRVEILPVAGCASKEKLLISPKMNSYADGENAMITTAVVEYTQNDDELAVVLSHEMAHNVVHDHPPSGSNYGRLEARDIGTRQSEIEADYTGVYLMARAGYAFDAAPNFWLRFGKDHGLGIFADGSHPGWKKRAGLAQATVVEIRQKKLQGKALTPDLPFFSSRS